jgi:hypothetical protein
VNLRNLLYFKLKICDCIFIIVAVIIPHINTQRLEFSWSCSILGCDAVWIGIIVSGEPNGGSRLSQNIDTYLPNNTASYPEDKNLIINTILTQKTLYSILVLKINKPPCSRNVSYNAEI